MATPTLNIEQATGRQDAAPVNEGQLVRKLRGERSYREFENYLNQNIPAGMPGRTTFASAWNWENNVHPVTGECLMAWMAFYNPEDPRHQLAVDIVAFRKASYPAHWVGEKEKQGE